jgi:5-formyltetrahydrofolate cyclo-ligase
MSDDAVELKRDLRRQLRLKTEALPSNAWVELSRLACGVLRGRPEWTRAGRVLFYYPLRQEIDLRPVLREALAAGRLVALPRYRASHGDYEAAVIGDEAQDLEPGWAGIPEPRLACAAVPLNQLDLVLVPGVGFDSNGRRLGRGRGFYDRLLGTVRGVRCGVAGEWQLLGVIPTQPHDERVDCILTPTRWIVCRSRAVC